MGSRHPHNILVSATQHLWHGKYIPLLQAQRIHNIPIFHIPVLVHWTNSSVPFYRSDIQRDEVQLRSIRGLLILKATIRCFLLDFSLWTLIHHIALLSWDPLPCLQQEAQDCQVGHEFLETVAGRVNLLRSLLQLREIFHGRCLRRDKVGNCIRELPINSHSVDSSCNFTIVGYTVDYKSDRTNGWQATGRSQVP